MHAIHQGRTQFVLTHVRNPCADLVLSLSCAGQYGNEKGGDDADLQDDGNSADVLVLAAKDGDG